MEAIVTTVMSQFLELLLDLLKLSIANFERKNEAESTIEFQMKFLLVSLLTMLFD